MPRVFETPDEARELAERVVSGLIKVKRAVLPSRVFTGTDGKDFTARPPLALVQNRMAFGTDIAHCITIVDFRPWELCKKKSPVRDALPDCPLTVLVDERTFAPWLTANKKTVMSAEIRETGGVLTVLPGTLELQLAPREWQVQQCMDWSSRGSALLEREPIGAFPMEEDMLDAIGGESGAVWLTLAGGSGYCTAASIPGEFSARVPLKHLPPVGKKDPPRQVWGASFDEETVIVAVTTETPEYTCRQIFRALRL